MRAWSSQDVEEGSDHLVRPVQDSQIGLESALGGHESDDVARQVVSLGFHRTDQTDFVGVPLEGLLIPLQSLQRGGENGTDHGAPSQ